MLGRKIFELLPLWMRVIRKIASDHFGDALTLNQIRLLHLIQEGQGLTQMAETLDVSLPAISKMINCLEKKEFVTRKSGEDRRVQVISITSKGRQIMNKISEMVIDELNVHIKKLSRPEREQLLKGLLVLEQLMKKVKEV